MGLGLGDSRPAQDQENLTESQKEAKSKSKFQNEGSISQGLNCDYIPEVYPVWDLAKSETLLGGEESNAFIVLGRDRPCSKGDGYGGKAYTGAGSIHLVAGLNNDLKGNPNFIADAATIHISQLTDIDRNFDLVDGVVGSPKGRSAIGMKADGIRIVGREGIKLVTTGRGDTNSHGGKVETTTGIDLIAGNNADGLEPIPKGLKVVSALNSIIDRLNDLSGVVNQFISIQNTFNSSVMSHTHVCAPIPLVATPDPFLVIGGVSQLIRSVVQGTMPIQLFNISNTLTKVEALEPYGAEYICSYHNHVN